MKNSILIFAFTLVLSSIWAQSGCTDSIANNFDPNAEFNDGSCLYDPVILEPKLITNELSYAVAETSGIIWYRNAIWSHNDSEGEPAIYKIDSIDGRLLQTIRIKEASNIDYEDITQDEDFIYIGDFGNNYGNRKDLCIYKIKKSDIPEEGDTIVSSEKISFSYKDQTSFEHRNRRNDHDCEAMASLGDHLYIFSKNWIDGETKSYKIPKAAGHYHLEPYKSFNVRGLITAADYNEESNTLTLIGYENFVPFLWLMWDFKGDDFFGGHKKRVDFAYIQGAQTEAICFKTANEILMTCEDSFFPSSLFILNLEDISKATRFNSPLFEPLKIIINQNPAEHNVELKIGGLQQAKFDVEIYDISWKKVSQYSFIEKHPKDIISVNINTLELGKGIFFVRVKEGKNIGFEKLMIRE